MDEEVAAKTEFKEPRPRIIIDDLKFDEPVHIPDSTKQQLIAELKQRVFDAYGDWLEEIQDVGIESVWRDNGYFRATVIAQATFISSDSRGMHVSVTAHVDEGLQYRLGSVQFRSSNPDDPLAFRPEELRKQIPMSEGDIFSAEKIRKSLDALKRLYGSEGYIDFVVAPLTDIDDANGHRISLIMELDQQKQFRLRTVEVFGLDPKMESLLRARLKTGDVFNWQVVEDFLKQNASSLPPDISQSDIEAHRDVRNGTVDLRFNVYQGCPNLQD
jgi:outer membrane protein insertion porin family